MPGDRRLLDASQRNVVAERAHFVFRRFEGRRLHLAITRFVTPKPGDADAPHRAFHRAARRQRHFQQAVLHAPLRVQGDFVDVQRGARQSLAGRHRHRLVAHALGLAVTLNGLCFQPIQGALQFQRQARIRRLERGIAQAGNHRRGRHARQADAVRQ